MASEEDFPRGGARRRAPSGTEQAKGKPKPKRDVPDLFKVTAAEPEKPAKKRKRRFEEGGKKKKKKLDDGAIDYAKAAESQIQELSMGVITEGMKILGRVKEVREFDFLVSLPSGLIGVVAFTQICEAYTQQLQTLASEGADASEDIHSLNELFAVGDIVRCVVKSIVRKKMGKDAIQLSVDPRLVNQNVQAKALSSDMVLCGCVSSIEDHGYTVDVGVKGLTAFLPTKAAAKYIKSKNQDQPLFVGQYLHCKMKNLDGLELKTGETRVVQITIDPKLVGETVVSSSAGSDFQSFVPGMRVTASVSKAVPAGLLVKFIGKYKGFVHKKHLPGTSKAYEKAQEVTACILYVQPVSKAVSLSLLPHLSQGAPQYLEQYHTYKIGDIIEEAKVQKIDNVGSRGAWLMLEKDVRGFLPIKQMSDEDVNDVNKYVQKASVVKCRVIGYNLIDNMAILSMKSSVLNQKYYSLQDVAPGSVVECQVKSIVKYGVVVKVTNFIKGFIPNMHLAEVMLKNREKKFPQDKQLKCRVLSVASEDNKLIMTNKKSLVRSELPILASYDQLEQGLVVEGYIVQIIKAGIVVAFYNGIKGFVPNRELSFEKIDYPEKVFYVGQVVKAQVLNWNADEEKLTVSFKLGAEAKGTSHFEIRRSKDMSKIEVGQIVECEVKGKTDIGLDVHVGSLGIAAFIPKMHLSDSLENCELLLQAYATGDVIQDAMCLSKPGNINLTLKPSLVSASREGILIKSFDDIKVGLMIPGVVKSHMSYGIFVDLLNNTSGLVPNKFLCDDRLPVDSKPFDLHQTVVTKVLELDLEKKRCLLSTRMFDCYYGDTDIGVELLGNYLEERKKIVEVFKTSQKKKKKKAKFDGLKVGHLFEVKISKITEHGALCQLEHGVNGVITLLHMKGVNYKPGDTVEALILYIDTENCCVELSVIPELIKAVKHRKETKFSAIREGQEIKCEVVLVKEEFVLVMLKAHGAGKHAYLPTKRHLNDVFGKRLFEVGQESRVIIKRVEDEHILASWLMHEEGRQKTNLSAPSRVQRHDFKLGDVLTARIKQILPFQLNIKMVNIPGRVFASEMADVVENGTNPLAGYKVNQEISVKVIGFRDVKTQKAMASLASLHTHKSVPECTIKESKLAVKGHKEEFEIPKEFKVGDTVTAFISHYDGYNMCARVTPEIQGRIFCTNLSRDLSILNDPEKHFKIGNGYKASVIQTAKDHMLELSLIPNHLVAPGAVVNGYVEHVSATHLRIQLSGNHWGTVESTDIADEYTDKPCEKYKVDQFVKCYIKTCTDAKFCQLSLRKSRVESSTAVKDKEVQGLNELTAGMVLRGFITSCTTRGGFIRLMSDVAGHVDTNHLSAWYFNNLSEVFYPGKLVTAKVLSINKEEKKVALSLLEADTGVPETIEEKYRVSKRKVKKEGQAGAKRLKVANDSDSGIDDQNDIKMESESDEENTVESSSKSRLNVSSGFSWTDTFSLPALSVNKEESSDSDSDEETAKPEVKKTKEEKRAAMKAEERKLVKMENMYLDNERLPETAEDFDRLCVQSPDSSMVWLRYMAFHLETAEIEKARAVAERALKSISFREEQEKLNIWVAYLNLENMYGTQETLQTLFQRAVQHNDPLKVYQQLVVIYEKSGKIDAAEQLYNTMVKRFSLRSDVWVSFGLFLFRNNKLDVARKLMQRALTSLNSLEKKHHVEIIAKFAQMEFKHGEPERGTTMFENILSNYPKRTDLWSVYIDMLTKKGDMEAVRAVFERVINLSVSAKKMKFFFKKYLDFEKRCGTEDLVNDVKQKALEYVETKASEIDS